MSDFFKFLQQNRPEIGLVDRYDLSEIYDSDERLALTNLLLDPDGLDQIYGLAKSGLTKEDIRTSGGLDRPIIHSLGISAWTLGDVSLSLAQQITTDKAIGEPGKQSYSVSDVSDNIIVFQGGIAAKKIEYNFLDEKGEVKTTTVPTSRESLFNSSKNASGQYTSASYPGLFRIRRRSHLHELRLAPKLLVEKGSIIESPTDTLKIPTYMKTSANSSPSVVNLQCYATKNSPLVLPVKIYNSAVLSFSRKNATVASPAFVYGWELKRQSDLKSARTEVISSSGAINSVSITVNTAGTICDGVESLLYVYLDPTAVTSANLSGLGMKEQVGRDIGLVGFDILEDLDISNNSLSTLPVWLKTLHGTLKSLNIRNNPFWNNGIVQFFDWQKPPSGVTGASLGGSTPPYVTLTQVLGYSGWLNSGANTNYDGTYAKVQDSSGALYKDLRDISVNGGTAPTINIANGFRPFEVLETLNLGPTVRLANPDFSKIFPNLKTLSIDPGGSDPRVLSGLIPKLNNHGGTMSVNLTGHYGEVGGSIRYLGNTITWTTGASDLAKAQFIGQFKLSYFDINNGGATGWFGGICTTNAELGISIPSTTVDSLNKYSFVTSGTAADAWSGWLAETQVLNLYYRDIAFRIASGTSLKWNKLRSVNCVYCGTAETSNKVKYNSGVGTGTQDSDDILTADQLSSVDAWYAGWYGKLFSISGAKSLSFINAGANNWEGYTTSTNQQYLLPSNFAVEATATSYQNLSTLYLHNIFNGEARNLEFRQDDLKNLPRLSTFYIADSYITGKFPAVYTAQNTSGIAFNTWFHSCRFRDLSALGSSQTSRVQTIYGPSNGTGVGGSLLPNFNTASNNGTLSYVSLDSTLPSRYPANWFAPLNRRKLIDPLVSNSIEDTTPSPTWTSRNNNNTATEPSEKIYQSTPGAFQIDSQVMVGDIVIFGGSEIGRVAQIDRGNQFIYLNAPVSLSSATLTFRRAGQDISSFFNNHLALVHVYLQSVKATGTVPLFPGCKALQFVYLNNNLLTTYRLGTLKNITGVATGTGTLPSLRRFYLENNALTKESVKNIINEVHDIAVYFAARNIRPSFIIGLNGTKYNSNNKEYQNWTKLEIFDQSSTTTNAAGESVTVPDPLETKFNQLGTGGRYPGIRIQLF